VSKADILSDRITKRVRGIVVRRRTWRRWPSPRPDNSFATITMGHASRGRIPFRWGGGCGSPRGPKERRIAD
jgi:hypothetical protein